jgi:predicted nucleotidyltransferase
MTTHGLLTGLLPQRRGAVLATLIMAPEPELHVREIARRTGGDPSGVMRELRHLEEYGIVASRTQGGQKLYRMNPDCPVFPELASLVRKTAGLAELIRSALHPLLQQIEQAYIYGSQAAGTARPQSDVDVMVVGDVSSFDIYSALEACASQLGRAVNPTVFCPGEYRAKVKLHRGFPYTAHSGPRIQLFGGTDEPV